MRRRQQSDLEERKRRLAALLESEDAIYEQEFQSLLQTPEQVREQMFQRLQELKAKRDTDRAAEVARRQDLQFKSSNDALRKEDAQFYNYGTALEREKQLKEKRRNMENKIMEEQVYAQLWKLDAQKKVEREILEAKAKQEKIADTMQVRDWQKQTREQQRQREKELAAKERSMLQEQWRAEEEKEKSQ